jgi:hypothetical protein
VAVTQSTRARYGRAATPTSVEPPDLAIAEFDFTDEVIDLDDRFDHA